MNTLDLRRYRMLVRVRDFGAAHRDVFPLSSLGGKMFAAVAAAADALNRQATTQVSGASAAHEGTLSKTAARGALLRRLNALSQTARAMAVDTPGVAGKFRLPRSYGDDRLLSTARSFAEDALPLKKTFIAHEMPKNFLSELGSEIEAFEHAVREKDAGRNRHIAARAGIGAAMDKGLRAVQRLDAIVPNKLQDNAEAAAVWDNVRRVDYPTRAKSSTPGPAAPAAQAVPPAPPSTPAPAV